MDAWKRVGRALLFLGVAATMLCISGCQENFSGMLNPKGLIADLERKLLFDTMALMMIVVIPVIIMSFTFVYHYRSTHKLTEYKPNWSHNYFLEAIWWGIPIAIIAILAVITWKKTHELDPYNKIAGIDTPPIVVQAIALPWKWLFIYPDENIATLNYLKIPVGRQIEFHITSDNAAMAAFFIPQLGSQIYAMAGMRTRLHLVGNVEGVYDGMNTQYNGDGFSDNHFPVHVVSEEEMASWVASVKASNNELTESVYNDLLIPSKKAPEQMYSSVSGDLFNQAIDKYMETYGVEHPRAAYAHYYKDMP